MTEAMTETLTELALFELLSLECRVGTDGTVHYFNAPGQRHRVYGPAIEYASGQREWYQNGSLHRLDGPAIECPNGSKFWYQNGQMHRVDGPAIEWSDGTHDWYTNNRNLTEVGWQATSSGQMETV